jgi:hypothetical protein
MTTPYFIYYPRIQKKLHYRVSQNSRIPNLERGREGPSGARKKFALPEEDVSTLILFNTYLCKWSSDFFLISIFGLLQ